jgi:hypothetical protein
MTGTKTVEIVGTMEIVGTGAMAVETVAMIAGTGETIEQKRDPFSTRMNNKASSTLAFFLCAL